MIRFDLISGCNISYLTFSNRMHISSYDLIKDGRVDGDGSEKLNNPRAALTLRAGGWFILERNFKKRAMEIRPTVKISGSSSRSRRASHPSGFCFTHLKDIYCLRVGVLTCHGSFVGRPEQSVPRPSRGCRATVLLDLSLQSCPSCSSGKSLLHAWRRAF